jgi:hypothetical protein
MVKPEERSLRNADWISLIWMKLITSGHKLTQHLPKSRTKRIYYQKIRTSRRSWRLGKPESSIGRQKRRTIKTTRIN